MNTEVQFSLIGSASPAPKRVISVSGGEAFAYTYLEHAVHATSRKITVSAETMFRPLLFTLGNALRSALGALGAEFIHITGGARAKGVQISFFDCSAVRKEQVITVRCGGRQRYLYMARAARHFTRWITVKAVSDCRNFFRKAYALVRNSAWGSGRAILNQTTILRI